MGVGCGAGAPAPHRDCIDVTCSIQVYIESADPLPAPPSPIAQLAAQLAQQYLETAHAAWRQSGRMHEKFDALHAGAPGGGGEYACEDGFGWTNGVALSLLQRYGWRPGAAAAASVGGS